MPRPTRTDPLEGLERIPWKKLGAPELQGLLRSLARSRSEKVWRDTVGSIAQNATLQHCHGPYATAAAGPAVPFLVALLPLAPGPTSCALLLTELRQLAASRWDEPGQGGEPGGTREQAVYERIARAQKRYALEAKQAVSEQLEALVPFLAHDDDEARAAAFSILTALPGERPRYLPWLLERLPAETSEVPRAELLLAATGASEDGSGLPVAMLRSLLEEEPRETCRLVLAAALARRLGERSPDSLRRILGTWAERRDFVWIGAGDTSPQELAKAAFPG